MELYTIMITLTVMLTVAASPLASTAQACLSACLANSTSPCTTDSLPSLMTCLTSACTTNSSTTQSLLITLRVSYTPETQYSCGNSMTPASETHDSPPPIMLLTGTGNCETSPYDFQSFVAGSRVDAVSDLCQVLMYREPDCEGMATVVSMQDGAEECRFTGGRSARLDCSVGVGSQIAVSRLQAVCKNGTGTAGVEPAASSAVANGTVAPYGGLSSSAVSLTSTSVTQTSTTTAGSSGNSTATASSTVAPYKGEAMVAPRWQAFGMAGVMAVGGAVLLL